MKKNTSKTKESGTPVRIADIDSAKKAGIDMANEMIGSVSEEHLHAAVYSLRMHVQQHLDVRNKEAEGVLMANKACTDALHASIPR